ncbi:hypothetical protein [Rhodoblastus sp.]|nr:hypothetical protein [Rhodoblastus sp.]
MLSRAPGRWSERNEDAIVLEGLDDAVEDRPAAHGRDEKADDAGGFL